MPYLSVSELPSYVKKYSPKLQRMFLEVFNSVWNKLTKEGINTKEKEKRAFMAANTVLKRNVERFGACRYTENSVMHLLIDKFLGNL